MSLARATEKHSEEVAAKKKERRVKKRMTKVNPDPSIHGEDVTKEHQDSSSSESSDIDRTPLGLMLADPRPPKQDPGKAKRKELESLPVLQLFNHHLKDFEGGSRKHEVAKDHTRLLHELEDNANSVKPLWDSNNLNQLKNNFFKGNDLLGEEEKRQPATLKAYIISLRLFFKFVIARHEEIRKLEQFDDSDIRLVHSALARLETWPKALTDAMNKRKADIRQRDVEEKLSAQDYETFFDSARARQIKKMYADVKEKENPIVGVNDFASMRDYLLLRVLVASGQRCGAASNLTLYEYLNGTWTNNNRLYVTRTLRHKTSSGGPAKLLWDAELKAYADIYIDKLRNIYSSACSVAPAAVGIPAMPLFFVSTKGNPVDESRASNRLAQMGKQVAPQLKGTLKSSRLRKSLVSLQRGETFAAGSKTQLAKQMGHSVETAEKYYNLETEGECDARVQRLIDRLTRRTVPPHTQEHEKEGEKETGEGEGDDEDKQSSKDGDSWMDDFTLAKRHAILHKVQEKPLVKDTSGIEKAKTWVGSSNFKVAASASTTSLATDRLFTSPDTALIEGVIGNQHDSASATECLKAIEKDSNCREERITERYTSQQLRDKVKTIRWKAARVAAKFR